MDDILKLDATGQLAALAAKRISALELLEAALKRHEEANRPLNAVVARDLSPRRRAGQGDRRPSRPGRRSWGRWPACR